MNSLAKEAVKIVAQMAQAARHGEVMEFYRVPAEDWLKKNMGKFDPDLKQYVSDRLELDKK